jgi:hypothetical protein
MHPRRFNPDNHFSKPLSGTLLARLADVFAKHGVHLDTGEARSMSQLRAAAKATKGKRSAGRPFGSLGYISGDQLITGGQSLRTEQHNGHACVRIMVSHSRVRLRLDALAEFIALAGLRHPSSLYSSIEDRIGELAPDPDTAPEADPLADILPENWPQPTPLLAGELASSTDQPRSLADRIAALKAAQVPCATACSDEVDPLAF